MRPKSIALLALALGCGFLASVGIYTQVLAKRSTESNEAVLEMDNVLVALQDIPAGEPLHPQMVKLEAWPKGKIPANALAKGDDLEQYTTKVKFYAGEPLIKNRLHAKGDRSDKATDNIPKGMRVISVSVDKVSGAASLIEPGDRVDLLCHFKTDAALGISAPMTRVILQNLKVFAIDQIISSEKMEDGKPAQAQTVSLLVTPEQAEKVTLATAIGTPRLTLRPPGDSEDVVCNPVTGQSLFNTVPDGGKAERELVRPEEGKAIATPEFMKVLEDALKKGDSGSAVAAGSGDAPAAEQYVVRRLTGDKYSEFIFEKTRAPDGSEIWKPAGENDLAVGAGPAPQTPAPQATPPAGPPAAGSDNPFEPPPKSDAGSGRANKN